MTTAVPLNALFLTPDELTESHSAPCPLSPHHNDLSDALRQTMDDLNLNMEMFKDSDLFTGDEERFAFARALSRLNEMGTQDWVERGMGLENKGGEREVGRWKRVRSRWREDAL